MAEKQELRSELRTHYSGRQHLVGGVEVFQDLRDIRKGRIEVETSLSPPTTKPRPGKEKLVEGVSRAPVEPESKGDGENFSKQEFERVKKILGEKEV